MSHLLPGRNIIQLIWASTTANYSAEERPVHVWAVDKHSAEVSATLMGQVIYGGEGLKIGNQSEYYVDQPMRSYDKIRCSLIDTPRERTKRLNANGHLEDKYPTQFAQYIIELDGQKERIYDKGIVWGYEPLQDTKDLSQFTMKVTPPVDSLLSKNKEHLDAIVNYMNKKAKIAGFTGKTAEDVKKFIGTV